MTIQSFRPTELFTYDLSPCKWQDTNDSGYGWSWEGGDTALADVPIDGPMPSSGWRGGRWKLWIHAAGAQLSDGCLNQAIFDDPLIAHCGHVRWKGHTPRRICRFKANRSRHRLRILRLMVAIPLFPQAIKK